MGINLADILKLGAGLHQQVVVDLHPHRAYDTEIMLAHQVIDRIDRAGGAVFHRDDAIAAEPLFDGGEDRVKAGKIKGAGAQEELFAGDAGIGTLHALAGHHRRLRKKLRGLTQGLFNGLGLGAGGVQDAVLAAAAELHNHGKERGRVFLELLRALLLQVPKLFLLPP